MADAVERTWLDKFSLGAAGIGDALTGVVGVQTTWAADVYAAQEAELKGLSEEKERRLADHLKSYQREHPEVVSNAMRKAARKFEKPIEDAGKGLGSLLGFLLRHFVAILVLGGLAVAVVYFWAPLTALVRRFR